MRSETGEREGSATGAGGGGGAAGRAARQELTLGQRSLAVEKAIGHAVVCGRG